MLGKPGFTEQRGDGVNLLRSTETIFPYVTGNDLAAGTQLTIRLDPTMPFHALYHNVIAFVRASGAPTVSLAVNARIEFYRDNGIVAQLRDDINVQSTGIQVVSSYGLSHNTTAAAAGTVSTPEMNVYHQGVVGRFRLPVNYLFAHADRCVWTIEANNRTAADATNGSSFFMLIRSTPVWLP